MASWIDKTQNAFFEIDQEPQGVFVVAVGPVVNAEGCERTVTLSLRQVRILHRLLSGWLDEIEESNANPND